MIKIKNINLKIEKLEDIIIGYEKENSDFPIKSISWLQIGDLKLSTEHIQDCCENVYADFEAIKDYFNQIKGKDIKHVEIKPVEKIGFIISLQQKDAEKEEEDNYTDIDDIYSRVLIPCYNSQNGYYSNDLSLKVEWKDINGIENKEEISLTDYMTDLIHY